MYGQVLNYYVKVSIVPKQKVHATYCSTFFYTGMPTMSPTATTTGGQCIRQSLVIVVVFLLLSIFFL